MSQSFRTRSSSSRVLLDLGGGRHSAHRPSGQYIAPSRYVQAAQTAEAEAEYQPETLRLVTLSLMIACYNLSQRVVISHQRNSRSNIPALLEGKRT